MTAKPRPSSTHVLSTMPDSVGWLYIVCSCNWSDGPFEQEDEIESAHAAHVINAR